MSGLAPVVSILNMKGGVGKTTISAHLFRHLYLRLMKNTLLIDFDPQFNLTQTIVSQSDYEKHKAANKTILSVMESAPNTSLYKVKTETELPPDVEDVSILMKKVVDHEVRLTLIPGDFGLVKYSLISDQNILNPARIRFLNFINETRKKRELICIDCNPSSSFMTVCALMASTHIIVPVRPDRYSILGLELLDQYINDLEEIKNKPKLLILLNGVKTSGYDPTIENSLRSHPRYGLLTLSNNLSTSKLLEASHSYTGFATDKKQKWRITDRMSALADELGNKLELIKK